MRRSTLLLAGGALAAVAVLSVSRRSESAPVAPGAPASAPAVAAADSSRDPMARLQADLMTGRRTLAWDTARGYLPALLSALNVPVSSQVLVFSRTSLQTDRIAPWTPRALYFNDDVYVGFVQESPILEIAAVNPTTGGVFYTLTQTQRDRATANRESMTCLMCHQSRSATGGVPGFMVLSTLADRMGYPMTGVHDGTTTDATPHRERYGGWYVTGQVGANGHAGNRYADKLNHEVSDKAAYRTAFAALPTAEKQTFAQVFDTAAYLTGQSDVVALMVLTHQTVVHNRITAVHEAAREAAMSAVSTGGSADTVTPRLRGAVENLARAMLFIGEAPLTARVQGSTTFAADFATRGPFDRQGRTLRAFDLEKRLFRYPMSFLVYSEAFDALPANAKREVYARLWTLLLGRDPLPDVQIVAADRAAIVEILSATKPDFAAARPR
ncbi:MAG: hypothetical protein K2R93_02665 [Gemmatimonadaceae bacterium]|nr:hypothetical protein [Gemmatimonadaceae bacterium]